MGWFGTMLCNLGFHKYEIGTSYIDDVTRLAPGLMPIGRCLRPNCGLLAVSRVGRTVLVDPNHKIIPPRFVSSDKPQPSKVEQYMHLMSDVVQAKYMPSQLERIQDEADRLWFSMSKMEHDQIRCELAKDDPPKAARIFFFPNGYATVLDQRGLDMGQYAGTHDVVIEKLTKDGVDWQKLIRIGAPRGVEEK